MVIHKEPAEYPKGGTGATNVVLEVVLDEQGKITDVIPYSGAEPFASAAIKAVRQYTFTPAKRGDINISSRVRVVVEFTPEADVPIPPPPPATTGVKPEEDIPDVRELPDGTPLPGSGKVEEVRIEGVRQSPTPSATEHRMARADIRLVPGAFGDPFRAIDSLPGVVPTISGLPYFYIRGAPPSAVGYYIDEVRVPYLFHFALGPGVIQPAIVDEVSLHPAAFPGRYGRYTGAIVAGQTRPPPDEVRGEGQIRIYDIGAYAEAPFADGRASAGVGGRYSYTAALFSVLAKDTTIDYRDYNARVSYDLDKHWRVSMFAFGAYDYAAQKDTHDDGTKYTNVLFASEFHRADVRLDRHGDDGSESRIAATIGLDRSRVSPTRFAQDSVFGLRARHTAPVTKELTVEVGADATIDHYSGDLPNIYSVTQEEYDSAVALFSPRTETATGAWLGGSWKPYKGFDFSAAMRADIFTGEGKVAVGPSPRLSMKVPLDAKTRFLGAMGASAQPPAFAIPVPAVGYAGLPGGLGYGWEESAGIERDLPWKFTGRAVGFHHTYRNLRGLALDTSDISFDGASKTPQSSDVQAYGLELYVNRRLSEKLGGFLSYTLSRAQIEATRVTPEHASPFDRTHVFQIGGAWYIGAGWRSSARFLVYTGWPDFGAEATGLLPKGRLPAFYRVDARIEKRWAWRKAGYISFIIEALNALAQQETVSRTCDDGGTCKYDKIGPIVAPSIGVEGAL